MNVHEYFIKCGTVPHLKADPVVIYLIAAPSTPGLVVKSVSGMGTAVAQTLYDLRADLLGCRFGKVNTLCNGSLVLRRKAH
jgi:hypothetical protein